MPLTLAKKPLSDFLVCTEDTVSPESADLVSLGALAACKTSSLTTCRSDVKSGQTRRSFATWDQKTWKAGHCQESHPLVTTVGWDSPPTHSRAVTKHVDAAGDVGHGGFNSLRASKIGYKQKYLVL